MTSLAHKSCVPCKGGVEPISKVAAEKLRAETPEWQLRDGAKRIERQFKFPDFQRALDFVSKVGEVAEEQGHHPDISFGWGYATISVHTHKIKGLHENDFILAAKIDALAK